MATISASSIVKITPSVLAAGGNALDMNGVFLDASSRVPFGQVLAFTSATAVGAYFGFNSTEAALANSYFLGFNNSNVKPGNVLFMQYATANIPAYLRGGAITGMKITDLQALSGVLSLTVDGVTKTTGTINLALANSFTGAAAIINTALTATGAGAPIATYDAISGALVLTSSTTGVNSTITAATGTLADVLKLSTAQGAIVSLGAVADTPATAMARLQTQTTNWSTFMTMWEPTQNDKLAFATWTNSMNNDYLYVCWDTDISATQANNLSSTGQLIKTSQYSGTMMIYKDVAVAAFAMGYVASIDFTELNGRATAAFKGQTGLTPTVTDATTAANLIGNGYNYYGAYATANDQFNFLYPGSVSGPYDWADSYIDEIWMSNQFQLALMVLLTSVKSIPYNDQGYAMIKAACMDVINQAVTFGAVRIGVPLSSLQAAQVNSDAGVQIDDLLSQRGWYLQVRPALPQVRAARGSPPCTFWYMDGQSVQQINLATVQLQ